MPEELHRLVYCSRANLGGTPEQQRQDIAAILDAARRNNARFDITGALLFSRGFFAQTLEGPLPAIERIFERIQRDQRHRDVTILQIERSSRRVFGEWTMAFAGEPEGSHQFASMALDHAFTVQPGEAGREVLTMLQELVQTEEKWEAAA